MREGNLPLATPRPAVEGAFILAYRFRELFAACLLLVASCVDGRSPTVEPTETSPEAAVPAPIGDTAMPVTLRMALLRTQQKAAGYDLQSCVFRRDPGARSDVTRAAVPMALGQPFR